MVILSFLHTSSDFVQVWVPEPLVYVVSLNVTSTQKDVVLDTSFTCACVNYNLLYLPVDSLQWQLVERWRNIRLYLCYIFADWCKIRSVHSFCTDKFDTELEWLIFRAPTVYMCTHTHTHTHISKQFIVQLGSVRLAPNTKRTQSFTSGACAF